MARPSHGANSAGASKASSTDEAARGELVVGSNSANPPTNSKVLRVLVVDDEPDARDLLVYFLETKGLEVRGAISAQEAVLALETFTADIILSDIGMPLEDGYSLMRRLRARASEDEHRVPAVAITAFSGGENRARALAAGFDMHLSKPVNLSELFDVIKRLTAGSTA